MIQKIAFVLAVVLVFGCGGQPQTCLGDFCYDLQDGMAMAEGDIILGTPEQMGKVRAGFAVHSTVSWARWPKGRIPFVIDAKLPDPSRIQRAIDHYHRNTNLRFIPRTTHAAYVRFRPWAQGYCRSWIGRSGSAQAVDLDGVCDTRSVIHELGHTVGLWHEHTRKDRDSFVTIHAKNILPGLASNFAKQLTYSQIIGPYDIHSVMHYRSNELSANGQPTITARGADAGELSNPDGLSAGDIAALRQMYPTLY